MIEKRPELAKTTLFHSRLQHFVGENSCGFDPFHRDSFVDLRVNSLRDGNVCLSVVIPETMTRGFVTFLESMLGLMKTADRQAIAAVRAARPVDLVELQQMRDFQKNFTDLVCTTFESLIGQGIDKKEAIKQTNALLKAKNHPWANHEAIRQILGMKFQRGSENTEVDTKNPKEQTNPVPRVCLTLRLSVKSAYRPNLKLEFF